MRRMVLLGLVLFGVGCSANGVEDPQEIAILKGRIEGVPISEISINSAPPGFDDGWSGGADPNAISVPLDEGGSFEMPVELTQPAIIRVSAGEMVFEMILGAGELSGVLIGPDSVDFDGYNAEFNRFLFKQDERIEQNRKKVNREAEELFSLDPKAFAAGIQKMEDGFLGTRAEFLESQADAPEIFVRRSEVDIKAWFDNLRLLYPQVFFDMTGHQPALDPGYLDGLVSGRWNHPQDLSSKHYVALIDEYLNLATIEPGDNRNAPREKLFSRYRAIVDLLAAPEIKTYLFEQMFRGFRTSYSPRDWGTVLEEFKELDPNSSVLTAVEPLFEKDMKRRDEPDEILVYREIAGVELEAHIFYPENRSEIETLPVYAFFHGGGWTIGKPEWGYSDCKRMAGYGMLAVSFEYRLGDVHAAGILESVDDACHAIRWLREQTLIGESGLRSNPNKIVAAGFSAGAHLASMTAMIDTGDTSSKPNALILQSSSYDFSKGGFFRAMTENRQESVSPIHQVKAGLPPALLLHATYDHLCSIEEFKAFVDKMQRLGNDFEYHIFDNVGHFFRSDEASERADRLVDDFLKVRGFILQ